MPKSNKPMKTVLDDDVCSPLQAGISAALRRAYKATAEESTAEFDALLARLN